MQVAEGEGDQAPAWIGMQWGTTMNASTVLVLVKWHKLEQDAATAATCISWIIPQNYTLRVCIYAASVINSCM